MRVCLAFLCNDTAPSLEVPQKSSENTVKIRVPCPLCKQKSPVFAGLFS
jgi:hypothetical protein